MTHLAIPDERSESILRPLSKYHPPGADGLLIPDINTIESLCTISAGDRDEKGLPRPARDGKIRMHDEDGRAPGLRARLEERGYESLVIGFGWNDPSKFLVQRRAAYVQSTAAREKGNIASLAIVGDERGLVSWEGDRRVELAPGTPAFNAAWAKCAEETWVYFFLAGFEDGEPVLEFPDNVAIPYRLRFGGINSRRALESCLVTLKPQFAIMPILLSFDGERPVIMPTGKRAKAPVWAFAPLLAPEGSTGVKMRLDSRRLLALREGARSQSTALALPEPNAELVRQTMLTEGASGDVPTDAQVELMLRGGPCDARLWERVWFRTARGTVAGSEDSRKSFLSWWTRKHPELWQTSSLAEFLEHASVKDAAELIDGLMDAIEAAEARGVTNEGEVTQESINAAASPAAVSGAPVETPSTGASDPTELEELRRKVATYERIMAAQYPDEHPPVNQQTDAERYVAGDARAVGDGECANCGTSGPLIADGETYVCADQEACAARGKAQVSAVVSDLDEIINQDDSAPPATAETIGDQQNSNSETLASAATICGTCQLRQDGEEGDNCADPQCLGKLDTPSEDMGDGADWDAEGARQTAAEALLETLLQALRPDLAGGEVFSCARCGKQVGSVQSKQGDVYPARQWLGQLAEQGIDEPLCLTDAQQVTRDKKKRTQKASGGG